MNNWERMKAGRLYNADSKDLEQYHKFGMETCDKFNRTPLWRKKRKQRLLEKLIPSAKDGGAAIFAPFYCEYGVNIHFGKGCFVNYKCTFLDCAPITLEDGVWVGANVTIATPCHPFLSDGGCRSSIRMVFMTWSMQSPSISEAEAGFVRVQRSVAE